MHRLRHQATKGRRHEGTRALCAFFLTLLVAVAGCSQVSRPPGRPAAADPCAERLHDIAGTFLLYYALNNDLPAQLADLRPLADVDKPLSFECPASGQPYLYTRDGLRVPGVPGMLIVYDPEPSHAGARQAIAVDPVAEGPLVTRVVTVPEAQFQKRQPIPTVP